jgi:putative ABC transport system permease protein
MLNDLRIALRLLGRQPAFALVAIGTLALGIGANTAVFSVMHAVLLKPLPYTGADRIVVGHMSLPDFEDISAGVRSFEASSLWASNLWNVTGEGEPEQILGVQVTGSFFPMLGVAPLLGTPITPETERQPVVVLSYGYWQRRFGGAPNALGRSLRLSGKTYSIIGVMPPEFQLPSGRRFEIWTSLEVGLGPVQPSRTLRIFRHYARLRAGVPLAVAQHEANAVAATLARTYPETNTGIEFEYRPLRETVVGNIRPVLVGALAAVGLLLLITCANAANLLLARTASRAREIATRSALGATRARILRQFLVESAVIATIGGGLGFVAALWTVESLPALLINELPRTASVRLEPSVLAFSAGITLLVALLFGSIPALQASSERASAALKEDGRAGQSRGARRLRGSLVIAEVALAAIVLAGAALVGRSLIRLTHVDPGFAPDRLLTFNVQVVSLPDDAARAEAVRVVLERLRGLPGVETVGGATGLPLVTPQRAIRLEAQGVTLAEPLFAHFIAASPGYFAALGARPLAGREFTEDDRRAGAPVVVINTALARTLFGTENPVGRQIRLVDPSQSDQWRTVVGVVGGIHYRDLAEPAVEAIYTPFAQTPFLWSYMMLRATGEPRALVRAVGAAVNDARPGLVASGFAPMDDLLEQSSAQARRNFLLIGSLAVLGLALTLSGIYGVVGYTVVQRTREIGVRVALGATRRQVMRLVVGQALALGVVGVAAGLAAAGLLTRLMRDLLFEISPTDPTTFAGVAVLLVLATIAASAIPARRATRIDPMTALRSE